MAKVQKIQTMKKTFTILMALMVLCFTQCKKPVDNEATGRMVKVSCTIPINKGSKSDFTNLMEDGSIKWSTGTERIYLALPNETNPQIVELTAFSTLQSSELAFEGEVDENLINEGDEYEVWYLGNSKNLDVPYITENKVGEDEIITSVSGSIAEQSGSIGDLGYCHIAKVSVTAVEEDGEIILPLRGVLKNQIAIAYLDLDSVAELSGAAIKGTEYNLQYNESTNKYDFVVTESATATINVTAGTTTSFIVLLPNDNNNVILKCSKGGYEFKKGVEGNKFYYRYVSNVEKGTLRWEEMDEDDEPDTPDSTAPKNLVATATGQTTILLKWDAVQNATSYKVYSNDDVVAFGLTEPTYTVENLTAGINYCYYVTAVTEAGESEPSAEACVTTEVPSNPPGTFTVNGVTFTMIEVEGNGNNISDYYIGETEVTQALWQAVMGTNPSEFSGNPQRPVEQVSWNKCQEFITKLNELTGKTFRLPTDAEWLYAAKGGNKSKGYTYSGSNNVTDVAWYVGNCTQTQNVKTKSPNELGIYDMSGNVAEWTSDIVTVNFNNNEYHHFRGGAYTLDKEYCKVTYYSYTFPTTATQDIGFRLCLSTIINPGQPEEPTIPEAPANLVATATGQTTISLTWDAVPNATSYKVYSNGNVVVSGFAQTTYIVKNLTPGIQYCYEVKAVNEAGESEASESACATTESEPVTPTVPAAPANLVATATGQTTISLTWNAVQNATSYNVYNGETVVVPGLTVTSYTVEGLTAGTEYCYNVTAVNEIGESEHSAEACATTLAVPTAPAAPTNLVATATGQTTISLTWDAVQNATSYNVYNGETVVVSGLTVTSYTVEGLTAGTEYCYKVTAVNEVGESEASTEACATTEFPPIVVETITVNGVSFNMIQVEGGTFTMGSVYNPYDGITDYADEEPAHSVTLTTYSIGETEVTQELWKAVMGSDSPASWGEYMKKDDYYPQRPAEFMTWGDCQTSSIGDCQTFISKLNELTGKNFRLPTEAEWEYAARGGNRSKGYMYSGSNNIDEVAWYSGNLVDVSGKTKTHDVKTKKANELGIYDMSGNVLEWCNDWYDDDYYGNSPGENPQGPDQAETSTKHRVSRGGGWGHEAEFCRVAKRFSLEQDKCGSNYGFRLCL